MDKDSKSFVVFFEWYDNTTELDNAQFGELFRAIFKYVESHITPKFESGAMMMAFRFIQNDIDRNQMKYLEITRKRSEAGRKGGAPIGNNNASKTSKNKQNKQNKHYDNDNVNDNDNVDDDDNVGGEPPLISSSSFIDEFFEIENEILGRRDEIRLSDPQIELLAEKHGEKGAAVFREFWAAVKESEWLQKQDISLMLNEKVFENVLNGVYRTYKQRQTPDKARDLIGTNFIDRD